MKKNNRDLLFVILGIFLLVSLFVFGNLFLKKEIIKNDIQTISGSSGGVFNVIKGNYDIKTKTYTSPEGYKQSMNVGEALKVGAKFVGSSSSICGVYD